MMDLFKKLFGVSFKKEEQPKQSATVHENIKYNAITFSIDQWDRMRIDVAIENTAPNYAETFGKLLYTVNHGLHEDKILECLVSLSKNNPNLVPSIQQALTSWGIMLIDKVSGDMETNPEPFVKPTSVFNK